MTAPDTAAIAEMTARAEKAEAAVISELGEGSHAPFTWEDRAVAAEAAICAERDHHAMALDAAIARAEAAVEALRPFAAIGAAFGEGADPDEVIRTSWNDDLRVKHFRRAANIVREG